MARNGQSGIPLFYIKLIKFQNFVEVFVEYTQFFFFSTDLFKNVLPFSCCPAESESVGISEISLSVFKLCQK